MERARLVDSSEEVAASAEVRKERPGCCSSIKAAIWLESVSRTEKASWMQLSRFERRIRASKVDVGWGWCGVALNTFEGGATGSSRGRSVKLV